MRIDGSPASLYSGSGTVAMQERQWSESLDVSYASQQSGAGTQGNAAEITSLSVHLTLAMASVASNANVSGYSAPRGLVRADPAPKALSASAGQFDAETRLRLLLLERMMGHKVHLVSQADLQYAMQAGAAPDTAPSAGRGDGTSVESQSLSYAAQQTDITATGELQTTDGKKIDFSMSLSMSDAVAAASDTRVNAYGGSGQSASIASVGVAAEVFEASISVSVQGGDQGQTLAPSDGGSTEAVARGHDSGAQSDSEMGALVAGLTRYIQKALDPNPYQNQSGRALPSLNLLA